MSYERLDTEYVTGYFDEETRVLIIQYHKVLTPEITHSVYRWLGRLIQSAGGDISLATGSIYDFQDVRQFDVENLLAAQRNSMLINADNKMQNHPVALVARTMKQREYVNLSLKINPQEHRKRIVATLEEAHDFIREFHTKSEITPQESESSETDN